MGLGIGLLKMSLQYNDTTNRKGIIQSLERKLGFNAGDISGSTAKMLDFTAEINTDLDYIYDLIFQSNTKWQFDDSNHTNYPIITTNIVSGQRDYTFTTDSGGNLILDVFRVVRATPAGVFEDIKVVDQETANNGNSDTSTFVDGQNTGGTPTAYDKTANGIFLDPVPNYNYTNGLKVYINREGSYFTTSDTTKKPGFAGTFHEILPLRTAWRYATEKSLPIAKGLGEQYMVMEMALKNYYGNRERDSKRNMQPLVESTE